MSNYDATHAVRFDGLYTNALDLDVPATVVAQEMSTLYGAGTSANQCNVIFSDTMTTGSLVLWDLHGGLVDPFGLFFQMTKVRGFVIRLITATPGLFLTVAGNFITTAILGGTLPTKKIGAGGLWYEESPVDGFTVTALTADTIQITPSASCTYQIRIWGTV